MFPRIGREITPEKLLGEEVESGISGEAVDA